MVVFEGKTVGKGELNFVEKGGWDFWSEVGIVEEGLEGGEGREAIFLSELEATGEVGVESLIRGIVGLEGIEVGLGFGEGLILEVEGDEVLVGDFLNRRIGGGGEGSEGGEGFRRIAEVEVQDADLKLGFFEHGPAVDTLELGEGIWKLAECLVGVVAPEMGGAEVVEGGVSEGVESILWEPGADLGFPEEGAEVVGGGGIGGFGLEKALNFRDRKVGEIGGEVLLDGSVLRGLLDFFPRGVLCSHGEWGEQKEDEREKDFHQGQDSRNGGILKSGNPDFLGEMISSPGERWIRRKRSRRGR